MAGVVFMDGASRVAYVLDWLERFRVAGQPISMTREEMAAAAGLSERTYQRAIAAPRLRLYAASVRAPMTPASG